jgi:hypothetical protein
MPIDACRLIRKMRGGAQAHLIEAADGNFYVVKFLNNPQHRRILVNEWIASVFLKYLGIAIPEIAMIRITEEFLASNTDVEMQLGQRRTAPVTGWHFGSRFPGNPKLQVVYDFLPDALLEKVENLADFRGVLAFDKWMGNADSRQAIFFRARVQDWLPSPPADPRKLGFVAQMMDNGFVFEGPHWRFPESAIQGLYFRTMIYRSVRGLSDFEPWLERIRNFPEDVVDRAVKQLPPGWLQGDEVELDRLLERLLARRKRVGDLVAACRGVHSDPFPAWK